MWMQLEEKKGALMKSLDQRPTMNAKTICVNLGVFHFLLQQISKTVEGVSRWETRRDELVPLRKPFISKSWGKKVCILHQLTRRQKDPLCSVILSNKLCHSVI